MSSALSPLCSQISIMSDSSFSSASSAFSGTTITEAATTVATITTTAAAAAATANNNNPATFKPTSLIPNMMTFTAKQVRFKQNVMELARFYEEHQHFTVPKSNHKLFQFCKNMKTAIRSRKEGTSYRAMTEAQYKILRDIKFVDHTIYLDKTKKQNPTTKSFQNIIANINLFKEQNGHTDILHPGAKFVIQVKSRDGSVKDVDAIKPLQNSMKILRSSVKLGVERRMKLKEIGVDLHGELSTSNAAGGYDTRTNETEDLLLTEAGIVVDDSVLEQQDEETTANQEVRGGSLGEEGVVLENESQEDESLEDGDVEAGVHVNEGCDGGDVLVRRHVDEGIEFFEIGRIATDKRKELEDKQVDKDTRRASTSSSTATTTSEEKHGPYDDIRPAGNKQKSPNNKKGGKKSPAHSKKQRKNKRGSKGVVLAEAGIRQPTKKNKKSSKEVVVRRSNRTRTKRVV